MIPSRKTFAGPIFASYNEKPKTYLQIRQINRLIPS